MTTNSGLELLVYLKDGVTPYAYIPRFKALSAMDEMSSGPGANVFQVLATDKVLADYPHILDYRNIVFVLNNGVRIGAMIIQTKKTVIVDSGTGTDTYTEVSGEGLRTWFKDAELYPEQGIHSYSFDSRYFNGGSGFETLWKSAVQWKAPVVADIYRPVYPGSGEHPWAGNPQGWPPQGYNAKWVWCSGYSDTTPAGYIWLRRTFTTTAETSFQLWATADNEFEAYVDGQLVLAGADWRQTNSVVFTIPAGSHVLAFKASNFLSPGAVYNPAGVLAQMSSIVNAVPSGDFLHTGDGNAGWSVTTVQNMAIGWTPGAVLSQILTEAQNRGVRFPSLLSQNFSSVYDSLGNPWQTSDILDWNFNVGDNYEAVITSIEAVGYEVWIDPAAMTINIAPARGTDRSKTIGTTDAVILAPGKNLSAADSSGQASMVNVVLTKSSDGWVETVQPNGLIISAYGRLEGSLSLTADGTTAGKVASATINQSSQTQVGSTYAIVAVPGATPKVDFNTGDWVLAPDENASMVARRVMSTTVTQDDAGNPIWACEFDTIFQEMAVRLQNNINAMTNGTLATNMSSSGSVVPNNPTRVPALIPVNPVGQDVAPAAPTGLACATVVTFNSVGTPVVQATVSWTAVTTSVFGLDTYVLGYQVWGINQSAANPVPQLLASPLGSGATSATIPDLAWGATWQFYVVAVLNPSVISPASATLTQTLNPSLPALTLPTAPTVTSKVGMVQVSWDGNLATTPSPTAPPVQFARVNVLMSSTSGGTYNLVGQNLLVAGQVVVPGLTIGSTYYFKLVAVDKLGNSSPLTAPVSVVVVGVATPDLDSTVQNAINNAQSSANSAQTSANGKNTVYYGSTAPTTPVSGSSFTVNDVWFNTASGNAISYWSGSSWTASQLGTSAIANASITNAQIANVDAGKITTGFISAGRIAADTITAPMLLVGDFTNIAAGSDFEGVTAANPWNLGAAWAIDTAQHHTGTQALKCTGTLTGVATLATVMAVQGAAQYYVEFYVYRDTSWNGTAAGSILKFVDQASTVAGSFAYDSTSIPATTWTKVSGTLTIPAASTSLTVTLNTNATAGNIWIDDITIRLKNTGNLIVDGAITAAKIAANTITASQLAAGAVTANTIAAGAIDGFVITGATIQTSSSATAGVKITSTGLKAYNASNVVTVTIDATTGALTATSATVTGTVNATAGTFSGSISVTGTLTGGTYQTASSGQRFVISGTSIVAHTANAQVTITAGEATNGGVLNPYLTLDTGTNGKLVIGGNAVAGNFATLNTDNLMLSDSLVNSSGVGTSLMTGWAIASGQGSNVAAAYTTVSFPANRFTVAPIVLGTTRGASVAIMNIGTVTTTSAQIAGFNAASSAIASSWNWIAIQMTSAAAAG